MNVHLVKLVSTFGDNQKPLKDTVTHVSNHHVTNLLHSFIGDDLAVMEKYYKENLRLPSDPKLQQIAKDIDLEVKRVKLWCLNRHQVWSLL